ncbi:ribosomal protein S18-alanine N-acetyltransferase [Nesterenkonia ebinurensis]|uniref:ribosomal protein S18-alanine N-acetyltransferase n=1 Tax=Nesterenkonia ebinurensis TaxID=2608252 RepID=UPI00295EB37C|nr:ribosomal protein S18-alanine N-acetyltransferase [Nesterenkonia ebinurensis]
MTAADVPEVMALERQLFPHDAWPERFLYDELAQAEPAVAAHRATRKYWVAEQDQHDAAPVPDAAPSDPQRGSILGYAGMMCVLPLADVQTLAVAPQAQGEGLGSRLLGLIEQESRRRGAEDLLLEVRIDNPGAQRLYRRNGFEQIHLRRSYYPDGGDALIMRKRLTEPAAAVGAVGSEQITGGASHG